MMSTLRKILSRVLIARAGFRFQFFFLRKRGFPSPPSGFFFFFPLRLTRRILPPSLYQHSHTRHWDTARLSGATRAFPYINIRMHSKLFHQEPLDRPTALHEAACGLPKSPVPFLNTWLQATCAAYSDMKWRTHVDVCIYTYLRMS